MFKTRLISGIVLVALALLTIITGGWVLFFTTLALSLIGAGELFAAMGVHEKGTVNLLELAGYLSIGLFYLSLRINYATFQMAFLILGLVLIMAVYVFSYPRYHAHQVMATFFAVIYVGVMLSYIYQCRLLGNGQIVVWLIFLASWGCDTCAYCAGMLLGKHKMAPVLSPKKSVEGAIGGVIGAVALGAIFAAIFGESIPGYMIICGVGALISMVGDLAASAIKRNMQIKDYGKLIPGHGGVLDRFDSVIFIAPVIYYLAVFLG